MGLLATVKSPADLLRFTPEQLDQLAAEIRTFLVDTVSKTGGHLGPNLGVVELTIALHRVFDSPRDTLIFDTGHQSYVHKLLTGRQDFSGLRQQGGLSGYPNRDESEHDVLENSHASAALSWADGIAKANQVQGVKDSHVVAVVGDGALTGGMAWEALNNIAETDRGVVIVVNDNGRSYDPTIGGLAQHLDTLRTTRSYEKILGWGKQHLLGKGRLGRFVYHWLYGLKRGLKFAVAPQGMFEDLNIKYIGPVNGHDIAALEHALKRAREFGEPVIVHAITEKGRGYIPAEQDVADRFHAVGQIHPETGLPVAPSRFGWTAVFADEIVKIGRERPDVVGITAAMLQPVGLAPFAEEFPERVFDVGIAEQHAVASAAGMAFAGLHPVFAVYATFLNRAFDQVLMDVALHRAGVTFVLDRAGLTGDDGASHNGMWDLAMLSMIPGLRIATPRDEPTLRAALREAVAVDDAPTVVRYPKGSLPQPIATVEGAKYVDVIAEHPGTKDGKRVAVVGLGSMAPTALDVGAGLATAGHAVTVIAPTWILPLPDSLVRLAGDVDLVVTLEDGLVEGGLGSLLAQRASGVGIQTPSLNFGIPREFLSHASREQVAASIRLTAKDATADVLTMLASM